MSLHPERVGQRPEAASLAFQAVGIVEQTVRSGRLLLLCCITLLAVTVPTVQAERPNVLLIVSDDQRPDTIAALGNSVIQTPHLDRLVHQGSSFLRAICANPICTPARAEILTGCNGFRCGVMDFGKPISRTVPTLAGWFSNAGYRTVYCGKWHNDGRPIQRNYSATRGLFCSGGGRFWKPQTDFAGRPVTGYRGWVFQDDSGHMFPEKGVGLTPHISRDIADAAVAELEATVDRPLFLHVCFTAPHDPLLLPPGWETAYRPADMRLPENFLPQHPFDHGNFDGRDEKLFSWPRTAGEVRAEIAAYYAVISHMDQQIGRILQAVERVQKRQTIVVFTSDHGVALGSHGLRGKQNMYEHTIGVPLIMKGPGIPRGKTWEQQCYLRDIFATLCDLTGIEGPGARIDSQSLVPVLNGSVDRVHDFVIGYYKNHQRMIRTSRFKYIEYPDAGRSQLFNLKSDPFEKHDLVCRGRHQQVVAELRAKMVEWLQERHDSLFSQEKTD